MKKFYYKVGEFSEETELKMFQTQEDNDDALIKEIFNEYKLNPIFPEEDREGCDVVFVGGVNYYFNNWEGDPLKWIDHTLDLLKGKLVEFRRMYRDVQTNEYSYLQIEHIISWLEKKKDDHSIEGGFPSSKTKEKVEWLGSPSQFGYLFLELEKNGFIKFPKSKGVDSPSKLAEICMEVYSIKTTIGTLKKEMSPKTNSLEIPNRNAFQIPDIESLS